MSIGTKAPSHVVGKPVGPVGYGLLGLVVPWNPLDNETAAGLMKTALEKGANLWNSATYYGPDADSLRQLRYYFEKYPQDAKKVVLTVKGAYNRGDGPTNTAEGIRSSVDYALEALGGSKSIDVFILARLDLVTPIETSMQTLKELVEEGKIGGIGLSEVSASTIRRAHVVHPVAAVEIELSLFTPDPVKNGIIETCHELSIAVLAYSPISRGWLAGKYRAVEDLPTDMRGAFPRFKPEFFDQNLKLADAVEQISKRKGLASSQVALAWVHHQGAISIPGSTNTERIAMNSNVVELTDNDITELQQILNTMPAAGDRYPEPHMKFLNA